MIVQIGCWVEALTDIGETGYRDAKIFNHAKRGDVGHVIGFTHGEPDWVQVFWERTGTECDVCADELSVLETHDAKLLLKLQQAQSRAVVLHDEVLQ